MSNENDVQPDVEVAKAAKVVTTSRTTNPKDTQKTSSSALSAAGQWFTNLKNQTNKQNGSGFDLYGFFRKVDYWVEDFVDEYFNQKHYATYLMCYALFLLGAIVFVFSQR